jgi:hypothetical protein
MPAGEVDQVQVATVRRHELADDQAGDRWHNPSP